jgi:prevent-host-death family protein
MPSVGAFEAKTKFSELLDQVLAGEKITITRHGHPVASLVPFEADARPAQIAQVVDSIRRLREKIGATGITQKDIQAWKTEGRR